MPGLFISGLVLFQEDLRRARDLLPVDDAGLDDLVDLEEDEAVVEVAVEVVDLRVHAQGVHPVHEHPLLPGPQEVGQLRQLVGRVQRRVLVEQVRHEGQVQLLEAVHDVVGTNELSETQLSFSGGFVN